MAALGGFVLASSSRESARAVDFAGADLLEVPDKIPDVHAERVRDVLQRPERHTLFAVLQAVEVYPIHSGEFGELVLGDALLLPKRLDVRRNHRARCPVANEPSIGVSWSRIVPAFKHRRLGIRQAGIGSRARAITPPAIGDAW